MRVASSQESDLLEQIAGRNAQEVQDLRRQTAELREQLSQAFVDHDYA